jgi:hypothetical protein
MEGMHKISMEGIYICTDEVYICTESVYISEFSTETPHIYRETLWNYFKYTERMWFSTEQACP